VEETEGHASYENVCNNIVDGHKEIITEILRRKLGRKYLKISKNEWLRCKSQCGARRPQMYCGKGTRLQMTRIFLNWVLKNNNVPYNFQIMFPVVLDYKKRE